MSPQSTAAKTSTTDATAPNVNDVVADKYQLMRLIGRGSMGEVWLATHKTLLENVALKLMTKWPRIEDDEDASRSAARFRFRFEAQVAARLSRKTRHIVRVTDYGEQEGISYLAMELLEGLTLEAKLMRYKVLPPREVAQLVRQVARALEHAHAEKVLHRDLKPSNLFLTWDEDAEILVKVLDFGIARVMQDPHTNVSTGHGLVFGTPGYMSPEQAIGAPLDAGCDLWALATIAYEALTNELPVNGTSAEDLLKNVCAGRIIPLRERRPDLPPALGAFFDRAFAERIEMRFSTATELTQALDDAWPASVQKPQEVGWARTRPSVPTPAAQAVRKQLPARSLARAVARWRLPLKMIPAIVGLPVAALAGAAWQGTGNRDVLRELPANVGAPSVARAAEPQAADPGPLVRTEPNRAFADGQAAEPENLTFEAQAQKPNPEHGGRPSPALVPVRRGTTNAPSPPLRSADRSNVL